MSQFAATLRTLALVAAFAAGVVLQAEVGIISTPAPVSPAEQARMLVAVVEANRLHQAAIEANRQRAEELVVITAEAYVAAFQAEAAARLQATHTQAPSRAQGGGGTTGPHM